MKETDVFLYDILASISASLGYLVWFEMTDTSLINLKLFTAKTYQNFMIIYYFLRDL